MAEFPALPMWTDAILADCGYMSDEKFGAYHRLLYLIWRSPQCRVPNDDEWLAERLNKPVAVIKSLYRQFVTTDGEDVAEVLCRTDGNWIFQKRLLREKKYLTKTSMKQSERAKSRWKKEKASCRGNATCGNAPTPTPTPTSQKTPLTPQGGQGSKNDFFWRFEPTDDTHEKLRTVAPMWDRQFLYEKYREFSKGREKPKNPQAAFLGWAKKFTKGKPP